MKVIRKIVDSKALEGVIALPRQFKNRQLELSVVPLKQKSKQSRREKEQALQNLYGLWEDRLEIDSKELRERAWERKR